MPLQRTHKFAAPFKVVATAKIDEGRATVCHLALSASDAFYVIWTKGRSILKFAFIEFVRGEQLCIILGKLKGTPVVYARSDILPPPAEH